LVELQVRDIKVTKRVLSLKDTKEEPKGVDGQIECDVFDTENSVLILYLTLHQTSLNDYMLKDGVVIQNVHLGEADCGAEFACIHNQDNEEFMNQFELHRKGN
jgi:hypothetical protein